MIETPTIVDWLNLLDMLSMPIFHHALLISLILSVVYGIFSFFIVIRNMAFLGAGIAHSSFGGLALGLLLGIQPFAAALCFAVLTGLLIYYLSKSSVIGFDTIIGILFAYAMALGAILLSLGPQKQFDIMGFLFGSILAIGVSDITIAAIMLALVLLYYYFFGQKNIMIAFDYELAQIRGLAIGWLDGSFIIMLAVVVVISIKLVGIILVSAMVVLPASFAMLLSQDYRLVIPISIAYNALTMMVGLLMAFIYDLPAGSSMVMVSGSLYFTLFFYRQSRKRH